MPRIELSNEEYLELLFVLGGAVFRAKRAGDEQMETQIRRLIGVLAPGSELALPREGASDAA